jgi:glycosyltransferase involved in cell wall biosynthesis
MSDPTQVTIAVPVHITDKMHLEQFTETMSDLWQRGAGEYKWYFDVNGCPYDIATALNNDLRKLSNQPYIHIEEKGGRPSAMNRALQYAREQKTPNIIYTNDDLKYGDRLPFDPLLQALSSGKHQLVGALSTPFDPGFQTNNRSAYQLSTSLIAEHYFFGEMAKKRGPHFRGDCFGMHTDFINEFPLQVGADDTFLALIHEAIHNHKPHIVEDAVVVRTHEVTAKYSVGRLCRYLEGRIAIVRHLASMCSNPTYAKAYEIALKSIPPVDESTLTGAEVRFKEARSAFSLTQFRQAIDAKDYPLARQIYGPLADATIWRQGVRNVVGGNKQTHTSDGEVHWSRPAMCK